MPRTTPTRNRSTPATAMIFLIMIPSAWMKSRFARSCRIGNVLGLGNTKARMAQHTPSGLPSDVLAAPGNHITVSFGPAHLASVTGAVCCFGVHMDTRMSRLGLEPRTL